jgi:sec-independent protein translocase protein TatC
MAEPSDTPPPGREPGEEDELETKPFLDHLEDLRWTLLKALAALFVTVSVAFYGLPWIMAALEWPLRGVADIVREPVPFTTRDLRHAGDLAARLKNPSDALAQYLAGHLSDGTRKALQTYNPPAIPARALRSDLVDDFNHIMDGECLHTPERFANIKLSDAALEWVNEKPTGKECARLNRLLLEEAFPFELEKLHEPTDFDPSKFLNTIGPGEVFIFSIKLAVYAGVLFALPFILYFIGQFVLPALTRREKRYLWPAFTLGGGLFFLGAGFCFFWIMPRALMVSIAWARWMHVDVTFWRVGEYVGFVTGFMLGMGLAFETPVVLLSLVKMGILSYSTLKKGRRLWIVFSLFAGALLTTPEVFTQLVMAVVLCALYEMSVWGAWFIERRERAAADKEDKS